MLDLNLYVNGFRYDLWANLLWLDYVDRSASKDDMTAIMAHHLSAQAVWVERVSGRTVTSFPSIEPIRQNFESVNEKWIETLGNLRHDPLIHYATMDGTPYAALTSDIARHVINHGTYHRGELRGICLVRGETDFPETDLIRYVTSV